jgi:hypothetical protein
MSVADPATPAESSKAPAARLVEEAGTMVKPLAFTIHVPDLRNGNVETIQQAAPKASIDSAYKWAAIARMPAADSVDAVEYMIRGTYAQLMSSAGAGATEGQATEARRKAIVIGSVRAGAAAAYRLTKSDMNITECGTSGFTYQPETKSIVADKNGGTAGGKYAIAISMKSLDPVEVEVIGMLVYLGMAVPVLQGASLVGTGHHYLPTTKNIFAGQKRQALGLVRDEAKAWVEAMGEAFDDMAFHKACHPISPPAKRKWAKDSAIATRLQLSGHGASAVRLPAIPSDAAVGKTCLALAIAAKPVINAMGHTMTVTEGPKLVKALEGAAEGSPEREAIAAVQAWAAANTGTFAFCAGIVQQVHETAGTGRNTLLSAYSVKKLMAEQANSVNMGIMYSRAAAKKIRDAMDSGSFNDPNIAV